MQTETIEIPIEILDKVTARAQQIEKEMIATGKAYADAFAKAGVSEAAFSAAMKETTQATEKQKFSFTELKSALGLVTQGLGYLKQAYELAEIGAQNQRLIDSGHELASSFGADMDEIVNSVKDASLGTVSELDIITGANRAMMLNVTTDAEKMGQLMQVAAVRARSMGISTTQAFNDIVTGIGRNSPLILDNLGIITKGWAEEAKAAGVAYDQQFILNKVLEQGSAMIEKTGGLTLDAAGQFEKFNATQKNTWDEMKQGLAQAVLPMIKGLNDLHDVGMETERSQDRLEKATGLTYDQIRRASMQSKDFAGNMEALSAQLDRGAAMTDFYSQQASKSNEALQANGEAVQDAIVDYKEYLDLVGSISDETASYNDKMGDLQSQYEEQTKKLADLTATRWWDSAAIEDQKQKLEDIKGKMEEETASYEENSRRRILSMLEEKLAADGLTEAETQYLEDLGVKWGIYTTDAIEGARAAREEVELLTSAFNNLPTQKRMNVIMSVSQDAHAAIADQAVQNPNRTYSGYAEGGIARGPASGHWELLHGDEAVIPLQNGGVPVAVNSGGGGGGMSDFDMQRFADIITRALTAAQQKAGVRK